MAQQAAAAEARHAAAAIQETEPFSHEPEHPEMGSGGESDFDEDLFGPEDDMPFGGSSSPYSERRTTPGNETITRRAIAVLPLPKVRHAPPIPSQSMQTSVSKRKLGDAQDSYDEAEARSPKKPKRGRGRPKKVEFSDDLPASTPAKPKGTPGRKPKAIPAKKQAAKPSRPLLGGKGSESARKRGTRSGKELRNTCDRQLYLEKHAS